jgi:hypothetical protein
MKFLKIQFRIYRSRRKWRLSVPFCPMCEAAVLEALSKSQIIQ